MTAGTDVRDGLLVDPGIPPRGSRTSKHVPNERTLPDAAVEQTHQAHAARKLAKACAAARPPSPREDHGASRLGP
jgi:hypothetical protein